MNDNQMLPEYVQSSLIFAARYAHSRKTSAAYVVVMAIESQWDQLSNATQSQLKKEARNEATCNQEDWIRLNNLPDNAK